jgi:hypothetical protein
LSWKSTISRIILAAGLAATAGSTGALKMRAAEPAPTRAPRHAPTPPTLKRSFQPTEELIANPERGFYRSVNLLRDRDLRGVRDGGHTLVFSYVRLDAARSSPLPP